MSRDRPDATWIVSLPKVWPKPPAWMSFSTLMELEACPRRWALNAAHYAHIWDQRGYPAMVNPSALEGSIVHVALENISRAFTENGVVSLTDERAIATIRGLGGYTKLISSCVDRTLRTAEGNPRCEPGMEETRRRLQARIPEMRSRVQRFVSRFRLTTAGAPAARAAARSEPRAELFQGSYAEVELCAKNLRWRGVADLVTVDDRLIEIRDFKTGIPKKLHELQLRLYALLWSLDNDLNPSERLVDSLVLSYELLDIRVPAPKADELEELQTELLERTKAALEAVQQQPPEARPSHENCSFCDVRQLCEEYWKAGAGEHGGDTPVDGYRDVQLKVTGRHGPASWDTMVTLSCALKKGTPVLLRVSHSSFEPCRGQEIRCLRFHVTRTEPDTAEDEAGSVVATSNVISELFLVSE